MLLFRPAVPISLVIVHNLNVKLDTLLLTHFVPPPLRLLRPFVPR